MMISYAQNQEDVLLNRVFGGKTDGFYIDVGANDPIVDSVTKLFYDRGWTGLNIEPDETCWRRLQEARPRDRNLNLGLSERPGVLTFHSARNAGAWSTFSEEQAQDLLRKGFEVSTRSMPVSSLAQVCAEHVGDRTIDFLKVDVESHEREVLAGADWNRWRPRVVLVEANAKERWEPLLIAADYRFAAFDGINRYYVRVEEADPLLPRFSPPVNVLDDFIPYRFHLQIETLQAQADEVRRLGRSTLALARGLRLAAGWIPGLTQLAHRRTRRKAG